MDRLAIILGKIIDTSILSCYTYFMKNILNEIEKCIFLDYLLNGYKKAYTYEELALPVPNKEERDYINAKNEVFKCYFEKIEILLSENDMQQNAIEFWYFELTFFLSCNYIFSEGKDIKIDSVTKTNLICIVLVLMSLRRVSKKTSDRVEETLNKVYQEMSGYPSDKQIKFFWEIFNENLHEYEIDYFLQDNGLKTCNLLLEEFEFARLAVPKNDRYYLNKKYLKWAIPLYIIPCIFSDSNYCGKGEELMARYFSLICEHYNIRTK